jgi:hypothetical protein
MNRETERNYVTRHERMDESGRWNKEAGYFTGLGDDTDVGTTTTSNDSSTWVDAFKAVLPAVASVYQQDQFNKMNVALINAGKPPISAAQYMATQPPTANVTLGPNAAAQKWIIYGGIGLLALVGLRAAKVI